MAGVGSDIGICSILNWRDGSRLMVVVGRSSSVVGSRLCVAEFSDWWSLESSTAIWEWSWRVIGLEIPHRRGLGDRLQQVDAILAAEHGELQCLELPFAAVLFRDDVEGAAILGPNHRNH